MEDSFASFDNPMAGESDEGNSSSDEHSEDQMDKHFDTQNDDQLDAQKDDHSDAKSNGQFDTQNEDQFDIQKDDHFDTQNEDQFDTQNNDHFDPKNDDQFDKQIGDRNEDHFDLKNDEDIFKKESLDITIDNDSDDHNDVFDGQENQSYDFHSDAFDIQLTNRSEDINVDGFDVPSSEYNDKEMKLKNQTKSNIKKSDKYKISNENNNDEVKVTFQDVEIIDDDCDEEEGEEKKKKRKKCSEICIYDELYVRKYWDGRLKLAEVLASGMCAILLSYEYEYYHTRFIILRVVSATSFFFAALELALHLFSLWHHLPEMLISSGLYMFLNGIAAICFAVASGLIIAIADITGNEIMNLLSGLFGILCMILFSVECVLHVLRYMNENPLQSRTDY